MRLMVDSMGGTRKFRRWGEGGPEDVFLVQSSGPYEPHSQLNGSSGSVAVFVRKPIANCVFTGGWRRSKSPAPCLWIRLWFLIK